MGEERGCCCDKGLGESEDEGPLRQGYVTAAVEERLIELPGDFSKGSTKAFGLHSS